MDYRPDGVKTTRHGEWQFGWILEGRAIQDVWMVPAPEAHRRGEPWTGYGTTIRVYDPHLGAWRVTWNGVLTGTVMHFIARQQGGEIVLEHASSGGPLVGTRNSCRSLTASMTPIWPI